MYGLDTNVLARYYVDENDPESVRQRQIAKNLIDSGRRLAVSKTVLLELEWVLRGYYRFEREDVARCLTHLMSLHNVSVEDSLAAKQAIQNYARGLDFADALHHASYSDCEGMISFDDRRFARRAARLGLAPGVRVPT